MAEVFDSDDDSVEDLTQPDVIDLSADDDDLAAALNAQLDEFIVIDDSDSEDEVQFVSQSPPKRRKVDEEEVTFVKSTPPSRPIVDVDADEAMARKLHEQINGDDVQVVERPKSASKPSAKKTPSSKKKKSDGPFGGRDVLKTEHQGLFDFLGKNAKSLRITDIVPNAHSEPGSKLYERFLSAYTFATSKKVKLLFHSSPPQNYPNIVANGLDPGRRGASSGQRLGSGEYFGTHARVTVSVLRHRRDSWITHTGRSVDGVLRRRAPDDRVCRADGPAVDARGGQDRRVLGRVAPAPHRDGLLREPHAAAADGQGDESVERRGESAHPQGPQARVARVIVCVTMCSKNNNLTNDYRSRRSRSSKSAQMSVVWSGLFARRGRKPANKPWRLFGMCRPSITRARTASKGCVAIVAAVDARPPATRLSVQPSA